MKSDREIPYDITYIQYLQRNYINEIAYKIETFTVLENKQGY